MKNCYYVYVYLDPTKPGEFKYNDFIFKYEPFYIGFGHGNRINSHIKNIKYNHTYTLKNNKIRKLLNNKLDPVRFKLYENLTSRIAKKIEIELIKEIGRRDLHLGSLCNMTDGGDGTLGYKPTPAVLKKLSLITKKLWRNGVFDNRNISGGKNGFYGKHHTLETKLKIKNSCGNRTGINNSNYGNKWSKEQKQIASIRQKNNHKHLVGNNNPAKRKEVREKIAKSNTGSKNGMAKKWELISPNNKVSIFCGGLNNELKKIGLTKAKLQNKNKIEGDYFIHGGWKLKCIT